jgi:hypothetical protein
MKPTVRLFGVDRVEIDSEDSWLLHAPPEKGEDQWKDGYSAKEQAKAWLRPGRPEVPDEWWAAIADLAGEVDEIHGRPEHQTALDRFARKRQHDLFACLRRSGEMTAAVGVEAKACEDFDGLVGDRATAEAPSNKRARCNLLAGAVFGRPVFDEDTGAILDAKLAGHGYQLWTAAVGTLIEAQARDLADAILLVHQFRPRDLAEAARAGDRRNWTSRLEQTEAKLVAFTEDVVKAGGFSHETEFVKPGTRLHITRVETVFEV